jgi:hypothetical protein
MKRMGKKKWPTNNANKTNEEAGAGAASERMKEDERGIEARRDLPDSRSSSFAFLAGPPLPCCLSAYPFYPRHP